MTIQYNNWPVVIKRVRRFIQAAVIIIALSILYINYGWLAQLFKNF